jgi:fructose-1,6-bisphosphatase I
MAIIFEEAGGLASNGHQRILNLPVTDIHVRTPIFIGSKETIETLERYVKFYGND